MSDYSPPVLCVSHIPSASSFYASLCQPLGLQYLSATPTVPACLHYGFVTPSPTGPRPTIVFSILQAPHHFPIRLAHITLSAASSESILDFHATSEILNKESGTRNLLVQEEGIERAVTRDWDGNVLEAVYRPRPHHHKPSSPRTMDLESLSTEKEARRVLEWQEDVARSVASPSPPPPKNRLSAGEYDRERMVGPTMMRRADSYPLERERGGPARERSPRLLRRETVMTEHYAPPHHVASHSPPREAQKSGGISGKAVLGGLLGVAAGAAFAYAMTSSETPGKRASAPPQPRIARRATYNGAYEKNYDDGGPITMIERSAPARSYISEREREIKPRYVEYSLATPPAPSIARIDERSHVSERSRDSRRSRERDDESYSWVDRPLAILPGQPGSRVGGETHVSSASRTKSRAPTYVPEREYHPPEVETMAPSATGSYVSARSNHTAHSHHSSSTVKPSTKSRIEEADYDVVIDASPVRTPNYSPERAPSHVSKASHASKRSNATIRMVPAPSPPTSVIRPEEDDEDDDDDDDDDEEEEEEEVEHYSHARSHHTEHRSTASHHKSTTSRRDSTNSRRERDGERRSHVPEREPERRSHVSERSEHSHRSERSHAREVPLPRSMVSGGGYEYSVAGSMAGSHISSSPKKSKPRAPSLAPSDSVSSVGNKRERQRLEERLANRMSRGLVR